MQNENTTSNQLATNDQEQAVQNSISLPVETQTINTQEDTAEHIPAQVPETDSAGQVVSRKVIAAPKAGASATKRTKNMVIPYLVSLVVGKITIKEVTKALAMTEAEVNKQRVDILGPILEEVAAVSSTLKSLDKEFKMMEAMSDRADVFVEMVKEQLSECQKRLNLMTGKG